MEDNPVIDRLERRIGHVERELQQQGSALVSVAEKVASMDVRSNERLDYIRERFDHIDERFDRLDERWAEADQRDRWGLSIVLSGVSIAATMVWFLWMDPLMSRLDHMQGRIESVEEYIRDFHIDPPK